MKKVVSIVCILLLLIATSNLSVNIHFCENTFSSINFLGNSTNCGGCCDTQLSIKEKSCCTNVVAIITTDDTTTSNFSFQVAQHSVATVPVVFDYTAQNTTLLEILKGAIACNAPPSISEQPFYILYNSLII